MSYLLSLIEHYGLAFVFVNVLAEQLGAPIPAYPSLIITGALLSHGAYSAPALLLTALLAALIADLIWYSLGQRYGRKVLALLCRISLSPDSCVQWTESLYLRWGAPSLLVAKFIPGFASIASALAGALGTRKSSFILFDSLGATLWAGSAIFLGSLFSSAIDQVLEVLGQLGKWGVLLLAIGLATFLANKWWQRRRFIQSLCMARISVEELLQLQQQEVAPILVDVRSPLAQQAGRIPGALTVSDQDLRGFAFDAPEDREVVVYCACPNEASAARVAKQLMARGFRHVRPLTGGIDAWLAAGYPVEP